MDKVEDALEKAADIVIDHVDYFWNSEPHFLDSATESDQLLVVLAAEVLRLRAERDELRVAPSAYELAEILLQIPSRPGTSGIFDLEAMAARIQQDRARLLDEAAERGVEWFASQANIEDWGVDYSDSLRAAIKGAAHE